MISVFAELEEIDSQRLLSAPDKVAFTAALEAAARQLGFEYSAFGMRMPLPLSNPKFAMANNYPAEWQAQYAKENYLAVDPTVAHGIKSVQPVMWDARADMSAPEFWEDARSHGLKIGWAQSFIGANGAVGMLTLARSNEEISPAEIRENGMRMSCLVQIAHQGMAHIMGGPAAHEQPFMLSAREIEVLRWSADGKTSGEVAQIMAISERTVNFHITNALEKLGANNKTAGVVKAALLRLL